MKSSRVSQRLDDPQMEIVPWEGAQGSGPGQLFAVAKNKMDEKGSCRVQMQTKPLTEFFNSANFHVDTTELGSENQVS
jgi:hypothetical protein